MPSACPKKRDRARQWARMLWASGLLESELEMRRGNQEEMSNSSLHNHHLLVLKSGHSNDLTFALVFGYYYSPDLTNLRAYLVYNTSARNEAASRNWARRVWII